MTVAYSSFLGTGNTGDDASRPGLWFDLPKGEQVPIGEPVSADAVIYGGGALGGGLQAARRRTEARTLIAWGVGDSTRGTKVNRHDATGFRLYGARDWPAAGWDWVPCPSCMSPLFDEPYDISLHAVFFYNGDRAIPKPAVDLPALSNRAPMSAIIPFLASASVVVTNSYHGAYWATLLGRRVVIVGAYSSKFFGYRFQPAVSEDWRSVAGKRFPDALDICRDANTAFYRKVRDVLAG